MEQGGELIRMGKLAKRLFGDEGMGVPNGTDET